MAHLYADEDFDYPVVVELRRLGHDVLTVIEAGRRRDNDAAVLAYAIGHGRAVLTCNRRHFFRLHRRTPFHHGIIACTRDQNIVALATRIHETIIRCPSLANQLLRVIRPAVP